MKKILGFIAIIVIIAIIAFLIFGKGLGFGLGSGNGDGDGSGQEIVEASEDETSSNESSNRQQTEAEEVRSGGLSNLPDRITITIKEDEVVVEDIPIENKDVLKEYLEQINTDSKEYFLNDENSILATYEWVKSVFEELNISLNE